MDKITKQKVEGKLSVNTDLSVKDYINDPYFVNKRKLAAAFLKKVGLPESFKNPTR